MDKLQECLANNMKHYRKLQNLSQEKLAEKAGASTNYIALIENGKNFPSLPMLRQIANALNIDYLDLFDKKSLIYPNMEQLKSKVIESITNAVNIAFTKVE